MRIFARILVATAVLAHAPSPCYALWGIAPVSLEGAKQLGMEVRSHAAGPVDVRVDLEFKLEGELRNFSEVNLRVSDGDKLLATAPLREDRSKPGRVVVTFTGDRTRLDRLTLWVMVPGLDGGTVHELRVKDFVNLDKAR
ncbi:MAG TPA: hypothetical protein VL371_24445 [Gemmataceae bacterium]|jgi:hypothetical protein|nr:hypothetical protein [Gemmataceae bacterium]